MNCDEGGWRGRGQWDEGDSLDDEGDDWWRGLRQYLAQVIKCSIGVSNCVLFNYFYHDLQHNEMWYVSTCRSRHVALYWRDYDAKTMSQCLFNVIITVLLLRFVSTECPYNKKFESATGED